jgi:hypothetical protein
LQVVAVTFEQALAETTQTNRHLLMGNGFSIAASEGFQFGSLAAKAVEDNSAMATLLNKTDDFEVVMARLVKARDEARDQKNYSDAARFDADIETLKSGLLLAIEQVHPSHGSIRLERFESCCRFLENFVGRSAPPYGVMFTTNYDLLVYWTLNMFKTERSHGRLRLHDGFGADDYWPTGTEVVLGNRKTSIVFLHGALHLFPHDDRILRTRYAPGEPLLSQIRRRLKNDEFPIFVSEGTSREKWWRIRSNDYLRAAYDKFRYACKEPKSTLFTFGHSLSKSDDHISNAIGQGKVASVYLGAYGGMAAVGDWAEALAFRWGDQRGGEAAKHPLRVFVYDTKERNLWR